MSQLLYRFAAAIALAGTFAVPVAAAEAPTLSLKRVVLVNSGLAFYEHAGEIDGSRQIELPASADGINDVLKSLVVQDLDGGQVTAIRYDSPQPVGDSLRELTLDLSSNPTLAQLFYQLRGQQVELTVSKATRPLTGVIVGVERRRVLGTRDEPVDEDVVTMRSTEGLRAVRVESIELTRFLNEQIDRDFQQALSLLANSRRKDRKLVRLDFQGEGRRRVRFGYVQAAPVWKTSYRLVLDADGQPFLQGWAIVENTTAQDWQGVELTLLGGRPVSFEMDLYSPLFTERPVVPPDTPLPVQARVYGQNLLQGEDQFLAQNRRRLITTPERATVGAPGSLGGGGFGGGGFGGAGFFGGRVQSEMAGAAPVAPNAGVETAAKGDEAGESFRFIIQKPVTLPQHQSALLPLVNDQVRGERVAIFNPETHAKHPLAGLKLKNTTQVHWQPGPITVFDAGEYAGDARISDIAPGAERLLSYALDLDVEIATESLPAEKRVVRMSILRGGLIIKELESRQHRYIIKNTGARPAKLLLERPVDKVWPDAEPLPAEKTRNQYRFAAQANAGKTETVVITERRPLETTTVLKSLDVDRISLLLNSQGTTPAIDAALAELVTLKTEVAQRQAAQRTIEQSRRDLGTEQQRLRENLKAVAANDAVRDRFLKKLAEIEDKLDASNEQLAAAVKQASAAEAVLEQRLATLVVE